MLEWLTVWDPVAAGLSLLANVGGAATLVLHLYKKFAWARDKQGLEMDLRGLELRIEGLRIQKEELERKAADHARYDPRTWKDSVPGEVLTGADLEALKNDFERARQDIADAAADLVDGYSEQAWSRGSEALEEALKYARIERALSFSLMPERMEALAELDAAAAIRGFERGNYVSDEDLTTADSQDGLDRRLVEGYVGHLMAAGFEQGTTERNVVVSELLMRRARRLSMRRLGDTHRYTIMARRLWAEQISALGANEDALAELEEIMPLAKRIFGKNSMEVHHNLFAQDVALMCMGQGGSAKAEAVRRQSENVERQMQAGQSKEEQEGKGKKADSKGSDAGFSALRWALSQWGMK